MEHNMEVDLIEILFEPLNISKYLRDASKDTIRCQRKAIFTEIEHGRRKYSDSVGKTELFKYTCFNFDASVDGQIIAKVDYSDFKIFATINSLRAFPHSITISDGTSSMDFLLMDLPTVTQSMSRTINCINGDCDCRICFYNDQEAPIYGGSITLTFSIDIDDLGYPCGFTLSEISNQKIKSYLKQSGHFFPTIPCISDKSFFVDLNQLYKFRGLMKKVHRVLLLQFEILAQQTAILHMIPLKIKYISSREELYWSVLQIFFGLEVKYSDILPGSFVLREFFLQFISDEFSLYYNPLCKCFTFEHLPIIKCNIKRPYWPHL